MKTLGMLFAFAAGLVTDTSQWQNIVGIMFAALSASFLVVDGIK